MVEFRRNFMFSAIIHAAIIVVSVMHFCRGMENHVPAHLMVVSLLEEMKGNEFVSSPLHHTHQRTRERGIAVPQKISQEREQSVLSPLQDVREDLSDEKQEIMTISINRQAGPSDVSVGSGVGVPQGYSEFREKGGSSGTSSAVNPYSIIRNAIAKAKTYPFLARKRRIEGTVLTSFRVNDRGSPGDLKIRRSSGYEILDTAALKIVSKAAPFPKVDGEIIVPITFKLTEKSSAY